MICYICQGDIADPYCELEAIPTRQSLITDRGELDMLAIGQRAHLRASADWGSPNYPPSAGRHWEEVTLERAQAERYAWRRDRGLSDDTETTLTAIPAWGASGDGLGK